jgi:hypothetical protein
MDKSRKNTWIIVLAIIGILLIVLAFYMMRRDAVISNPPSPAVNESSAVPPVTLQEQLEAFKDLPPLQMNGLTIPNYTIILGRVDVAREDVAGKFYMGENRTAYVLYHNKEAVGFQKDLTPGVYTLSFLIKGSYMPPVKLHLYVNNQHKGDVIVNAINLWQGVEVNLGRLEGKTDVNLIYFDDEAKFNDTTGEYYDDRNVYIKSIVLYRVQ